MASQNYQSDKQGGNNKPDGGDGGNGANKTPSDESNSEEPGKTGTEDKDNA